MRRPGHWYRGIPSRNVSDDILICQIPPRLSKRQGLATQLLEPQQAQLATQGITNHVASGAASLPAKEIEELLEIGIEPDGDGGFHVRQCTTAGEDVQGRLSIGGYRRASAAPGSTRQPSFGVELVSDLPPIS